MVTRPEPEASDLKRRLIGLGHEVLVQPLIRIAFNPEPEGLARPAVIAVTSRNGVRAVAGWRQASRWRDVPVYAVGEATAVCAREAGFSDVRAAAGDAAALASSIRDGVGPGRGVILHPVARDRAVDLAALLPGFLVTSVEAYRAESATELHAAVVEALRNGDIEGVLLFSRRTAQIFTDLVTKAGVASGLTATTLYVLSPQVAEAVAPLRARVIAALQPDEAALLALLHPALARPA